MAQETERPATGMILGKFLPPHRGHEHLINSARDMVAHLTVIVGSLKREPIPGHLRFQWMKELYPDVEVVHLEDENPQEPHEDPNFWEIWIASIRRILPSGPDVVFTSEDYGEELARRLGARHVLVDRERSHVPVSGTAIRSDPYANWDFLPECVRPYFARRICIVGAESTGKTVLAQRLADHFATIWVPEFARAYLDDKGAPVELSDIDVIANGQLKLEDEMARRANRVLICDTDLMTTTMWSDHFFGQCSEWIRQEAVARRYDLYLLTANDTPWTADWQRLDDALRGPFRERLRAWLDRHSRPYVEISGTYERRMNQAVTVVESLLKG